MGRPARPWARSASAGESRQLVLDAGTAAAAGAVGLTLILAGPRGPSTVVLLCAAAVAALDALVAVQVTGRVGLGAAAHPTDVVVGDPYGVDLRVAGPRQPVVLRTAAGDVHAEPPATGRIESRARARGVVRLVGVEVRSRGLAGLVGCRRPHAVPLDRPVEVGPRPVAPDGPFPELAGGWGEGAVAPAPDAELVRGVRDYLPGDRLRQVHWRATARHGELVVKETEAPQAPVLHLVLDLGAGGDAGEAAAGRAAWYAGEALRRGYHVTLTTVEAGSVVTDAVPSMLVANRRLARATAGTPPRPRPPGGAVQVLVVSDQGDEWP